MTTAVEWLANQLPLGVKGSILDKIEKALEIKKEQIVDGIVQTIMNKLNIYSEVGILNLVEQAEQYYKENFKQQEQ